MQEASVFMSANGIQALLLNKVKLLVLWVGFSSENENRPYIVIHLTFFE